jgi:thiol:disulfide interchange protein DsbC
MHTAVLRFLPSKHHGNGTKARQGHQKGKPGQAALNLVTQLVTEFESMHTRYFHGLVTTIGWLVTGAVAAGEIPAEYQFVQDAFPNIEITSIEPSPVDGLLQISVGADMYYVSQDAKYLVLGDIYVVTTRDNITEAKRGAVRADYISKMGQDDGVLFAADDQKYIVTVFTDIDCPYCRKLHREIDAYNAAGISVRYLFFPRKGPGTPGWAKADAIWCSEHRQQALTDAKNGVLVEAENCGATPVAAHYKLGKDIGIAGTPAILTANGQLISGYHTADELLEILQDES